MSGEVGETEGLIRHLVDLGHDVTFYGKYLGEDLGARVVEPSIAGHDEKTTRAMQELCWETDIPKLQGCEACIMSSGYAVAAAVVDNPWGARVQAAAIRYVAPILAAIHQLDIPRIVINNDPRCYPRDQEMTMLWRNVRPHALLDQSRHEYVVRVGGEQYLRRAVYARCESWAWLPTRSNLDEIPVTCVAHAHIRDGCRQRDRQDAWRDVLEDSDCPVYGKGWENQPVNWKGVLKQNEVLDEMRRATCSPCVAQKNFYTGKVYVLISQGCIPLLYGDGHSKYTWDPWEQFLPLDSEWRIVVPGDLARLIKMASAHREGLREEWAEACLPDWDVLDQMLTELPTADWQSKEWWVKYGGYWPL